MKMAWMTQKHAGPIFLSNVLSLLLRKNKNPNVRHKTLSLKVTSDETVMANNWQTRVLRYQFLTKEGIKLQLTESVGSPISLGKPHQHSMWSQKNTINLSCTPFPIPVTFCRCQWHTQFTVSTAQCSVASDAIQLFNKLHNEKYVLQYHYCRTIQPCHIPTTQVPNTMSTRS